MDKVLMESRKIEDCRVRNIGSIAAAKDLTFGEAEALYNNDLAVRTIAELALCMDITYKKAEEYHNKMVATTKLLIIKDKMKTIIDSFEKIV